MRRHVGGQCYTEWTALRDARLNARLTWGQLAERVNRSYVHIREVEQGRAGVSDELLFALADFFGMQPSELARTRPPIPPRGSVRRSPPSEQVAS